MNSITTNRKVKSFDGTIIAYRIVRRGGPVLFFVHGLSGNVTGWESQLNYFEESSYSTIALDLRGHGGSGLPLSKESFSVDSYARDLNAILEQEGIGKAIFVGHCFGGLICQQFYKLFPQRVEALILCNTGYKSPYATARFPALSKISKPLMKVCSSMAWIVDHTPIRRIKYPYMNCTRFKRLPNWLIMTISTAIYTHARTILRSQEAMITFSSHEVLKSIAVPTLLIAGRRDKFFPVRVLEDMNEMIRGSTLKVVNCKHLGIMKKADDVNGRIVDFVEGMSSYQEASMTSEASSVQS